jgi:hypothetical protein
MRRISILIAFIITLAALAGCGSAPAADAGFGAVANEPHDHSEGSHPPVSDDGATAGDNMRAVLATSEVVVGENRLALGLLEDNVPIKDGAETAMTVRYFKLNGNLATPAGEEQAVYYDEGLGDRGTFIIRPTFDAAGTWGMEIEATRPGQEPFTQRMSLDVAERGSAPKIGDEAPRSDTPTAADVSDLRDISSDVEPDPRLHQLSIADAVSSGKPSLILFATPGYCQTAVCGPGVDVVQRLADTFGDRVNAVHVEIYELPYDGTLVPAMREWGLQTEPWLFLVDGSGTIAARYEGGITFDELRPDVDRLVDG